MVAETQAVGSNPVGVAAEAYSLVQGPGRRPMPGMGRDPGSAPIAFRASPFFQWLNKRLFLFDNSAGLLSFPLEDV